MTKPLPAPHYAIIYQDNSTLFLEFPTLVLRFPFTEAGLHKALKHIPSSSAHPGYVARNGNIPDHKLNVSGKIARISPTTKRKREVAKITDEQRSAVNDLLRKRGLG